MQLRVTAQLIEGASGSHLWTKRYDRELSDAFLVGDQIAEDIVASLDVKLARGEDSRGGDIGVVQQLHQRADVLAQGDQDR